MTSEYTPGPWHRDADSGLNCDVRAANGRKVALTWGLSTTKAAQYNRPAYRQECDANAHLIAAAPELLAALEGLLAIVDDSEGVAGYHRNGEVATWSEFADEINAAVAAIDKATQRTLS